MGRQQDITTYDNYMTPDELKAYMVKKEKREIKFLFETFITESISALTTVGSNQKMLGIEGRFVHSYLLKDHLKTILELTDKLIDDSLSYGNSLGKLKLKKVCFIVKDFNGPERFILSYINPEDAKKKSLNLIKKIVKENENISLSEISFLGIYE